MYSRSQRAETRGRARDELKRVMFSLERVRKWEKRWALVKDSSVRVYKWMPTTGPPAGQSKPQNAVNASTPAPNEDSRASLDDTSSQDAAKAITASTTSTAAASNSAVVGKSTTKSSNANNPGDDSMTGFSEASDSNQTFEPNYKDGATGSTDFSALRAAELAKK